MQPDPPTEERSGQHEEPPAPAEIAAGMPPYWWCLFKDSTKAEITSMYAPTTPYPEEAERLPASDPRVASKVEKMIAALQPEPYAKLRRVTIESVDDLYRLADQFDTGTPKPLYRGQSSYDWPLQTRLERNAPEFVLKETGLEVYEYRVMTEAQRRLHHFVEKLPDEDDLLSWLALLRHHGVPTRLLDATRSLFVACYFALRNAKPGCDAAVWIFSRLSIDGEFRTWSARADSSYLRKSPFTVAEYGEPYYWPMPKKRHTQIVPPTLDTLRRGDDPWLDFTATLDAAIRGYIEKPGLAVAEPFWLSRRLDVQQGAFLIPFNVRVSFEDNLSSHLRTSLSGSDEETVPKDWPGLCQLWNHFNLIKLRLPASLHAALRVKLEAMNIRELTLFPDLEGALAHLSAFVPVDGR